MKRMFIAATFAATLSAGSAVAADLPVSVPAAIPAPMAFNWTGFYVGAHIGYSWGRATSADRGCTGPLCGFDENIPGLGYRTSPDGFIGGFQLGYNLQVNQLVFGVEADITFRSASASLALVTVPPDDFVSSRQGTFGTITGRLGFAADRALFYVRGGLAIGQVRSTAADLIDGTANIDLTDLTSVTRTRYGYALGAGFEWAFAQNWSARAEYMYIDLGRFTSTNVTGDTYQHRHTSHTVRLGINYLFNTPPPAVSARF